MSLLLVTGSSGLIGSEVVRHFDSLGWEVHGFDNNLRADFFGNAGDTTPNLERLKDACKRFSHHDMDIRSPAMESWIANLKPDAIVNCAAQPSHDLAAKRVFQDFSINAEGPLILLEYVREHVPGCVFVHMSTNKVYGDRPNEISLREVDTRWKYVKYDIPSYYGGIPETFPVDQSMHSLFGASKLAGDIIVQEYGRYFGMKTCCLRGGCLTGPNHAGVELHGFLSYLVKCNLKGTCYKVFGYKGKQVRDNIHAYDVARFIEEFIKAPRSGEVYNIGGGEENSVSILESFKRVEKITGNKMKWEYTDHARKGDHICYYSDLRKCKQHYPAWSITKSLDDIFRELCDAR